MVCAQIRSINTSHEGFTVVVLRALVLLQTADLGVESGCFRVKCAAPIVDQAGKLFCSVCCVQFGDLVRVGHNVGVLSIGLVICHSN